MTARDTTTWVPLTRNMTPPHSMNSWTVCTSEVTRDTSDPAPFVLHVEHRAAEQVPERQHPQFGHAGGCL